MRAPSALGAMLCVLALTCQAGDNSIYKWTDAKGVVHYGDRPAPPGEMVKSEQAIDKSQLTSGENLEAQKALATGARDNSQKQREQAGKEQSSKEAAEREAARAKTCQSAKDAQRTLQAGGRVAGVNEKGERYFLSDEDIAAKARDAQKAVDDNCSPLPATAPSSASGANPAPVGN